MTDPKDYQATDGEVKALIDQVKRDEAERMEQTRNRVKEFQKTGWESVE